MGAIRCVVLGLLVALCGTTTVWAQASIPVTRVDELAGDWRGWNNDANPVDFVVQSDGSFEARIRNTTTGQVTTRRGTMRLENGEVLYDADLSFGKITLHPDGQKRKFVLHGTYKANMGTQSGRNFQTEYSEAK